MSLCSHYGNFRQDKPEKTENTKNKDTQRPLYRVKGFSLIILTPLKVVQWTLGEGKGISCE